MVKQGQGGREQRGYLSGVEMSRRSAQAAGTHVMGVGEGGTSRREPT